MTFVSKLVNTSLEYSKLKSDCVNPYKGFACRQCANCASRTYQEVGCPPDASGDFISVRSVVLPHLYRTNVK